MKLLERNTAATTGIVQSKPKRIEKATALRCRPNTKKRRGSTRSNNTTSKIEYELSEDETDDTIETNNEEAGYR